MSTLVFVVDSKPWATVSKVMTKFVATAIFSEFGDGDVPSDATKLDMAQSEHAQTSVHHVRADDGLIDGLVLTLTTVR